MSFAHPNGKETTFPALTALYGGRWRAERRIEVRNQSQIVNTLFPDFASEDAAETTAATSLFADLHLVGKAVLPGEKDGYLTLIYETLTDEFVDETPPVSDYDLNGLKRTPRQLIALPGTSTADFVVGVQTYGENPVQYLASLKVEEADGYTRVNATYLQPGIVSKARAPGPIHGSIQHDWDTWLLDATDAEDMGGGGNTIPGEVTADVDSNYEGYKTRRFTAVAPITGTLTGVKVTYPDIADVHVPGTLELVTQAVTAGDLSGTIAVPRVTPPRTKSLAVTVTIEITTNPSGMSGTPAYDLGDISCSVVATQAAYNANGFDSMSTLDGTNTRTAARRSASIGARIANYPGCYLIGDTTKTGTFSYVAGEQMTRSSSGTVVTGTDLTSTEVNTLTGYGSTSATGYVTTGIISRSKPRAVLQTLSGVTYYEVVTFSV